MVPASQYGVPGAWPLELLTTVTLEEIGGKTRLNLRHEGLAVGGAREMAGSGWNGSFDKLEACLERAGPS